jgi:hypothetical protein
MDKINNLLQQVSIIQRKYAEIAKITGENFNVFSVLKMDSKEVQMHSAFIGELLNPNGSHGLKEEPLKIFIDLLKSKFNKTEIKEEETILIPDKFILNTESAIATIEKYIGFTNEDKTEGGRIDIILEDKNKNAIIIENKIYAIEQTNQLIRYNNYSQNSPILYLTLYGDAPTSHGELNENIHYFNISYEEDIKEWLELCLKEAVEYPMLREVIKQYIYLIKKLTNQSTNNKMSKDLVERMEKEIQASFEVANNLSELKKKIFFDFIQTLKETKEYNVEDTNHSDYYGVDIRCIGFENRIRMLFGKRKDKDYCNSVSCGYQIDKISELLLEKYKLKGFEVNSTWVYKWINTGNWGNSPDIWEDVAKGKNGKIYDEIISVINEIIEIEKIYD